MTDAKRLSLRYSIKHSGLAGGVAQLVEYWLSMHKFNPQHHITRAWWYIAVVPAFGKWMETERSGFQGQMALTPKHWPLPTDVGNVGLGTGRQLGLQEQPSRFLSDGIRSPLKPLPHDTRSTTSTFQGLSEDTWKGSVRTVTPEERTLPCWLSPMAVIIHPRLPTELMDIWVLWSMELE